MSQTDGWTKKQALVLIREFEKYPCLYSPVNKDFLNKTKKSEKFQLILEEVQKIKANVTISCIKKKIRTLQSQVSRERIKLRNSIKSGAGSDEVYHPKLWCYTELSFLFHVNDSLPSSSNINLEQLGIDDIAEDSNLPNPKRRNIGAETTEFQQEAISAIREATQFMRAQTQSTQEDDFCTYLSIQLKKLNLKRAAFNKLRTNILKLVDDIAEEKENNQLANARFYQPTGNTDGNIYCSTPISSHSNLSTSPIFSGEVDAAEEEENIKSPTTFSSSFSINTLEPQSGAKVVGMQVIKKANIEPLKNLPSSSKQTFESKAEASTSTSKAKDMLQLAMEHIIEDYIIYDSDSDDSYYNKCM